MKITEQWLMERCDEDCGCLIWKLQVTRDGAPITKPIIDGKRVTRQVRRLVWEMRNGPIPEGRRVTYTCTNPRCLSCIELTTHGEVNVRNWSRPDVRARKVAAITKASRGRGKLDMEKARYIRTSERPLKDLAIELGISMTTASLVRRGLAWREERNPFVGLGASNDSRFPKMVAPRSAA